MITKKKGILRLRSQLTPEEYAMLKLALVDICLESLSLEMTDRGKDGLHRVLSFFRPMFEYEIQEAMSD